MWVLGQRQSPAALYSWERARYPLIGEWVGPRASLHGCGKSRPTGIRCRDRPARSQQLYRLRQPRKTSHMSPSINTFNIFKTASTSYFGFAKEGLQDVCSFKRRQIVHLVGSHYKERCHAPTQPSPS
jgi:hypothetical protein